MGLPLGQGWGQIGALALALVLSAAIGLEREMRLKDAGLRTHTLVGTGAALFILVSKFAFYDVVQPGHVLLDPSRVAAQIVSGIGFLGAGLIFVRRDSVRGLTTAATIWLCAAVGTAAGGGMWLIAVVATVMYFLVAIGFPYLQKALPRSSTAISVLRVRYPDGHGLLRQLLEMASSQGFGIDEVMVAETHPTFRKDGEAIVEVGLRVHGRRPVTDLASAFSEVDGVEAFVGSDPHAYSE
ncbi:MAG: MgtC/SapB family protein [Candidatus Dormibacteraeota bacterium]|nr:MgtC/SapB family protein [Candidatus Dormibacteraeota bacterium]MBO0746014.1 MgtC/SapB family protein [Candidatus Dormibacteraeota bacterium]